MKHDLGITIVLVVFFLVAQLVGLALINMDIKEVKLVDGKITIVHDETSLGPRPEMSGIGTFAYIAVGLLIGTLLILLIIRMKKVNLWKAWFFVAVFLAISLSLGVFLPTYVALVIALLLAILKVIKPNVFIHNLTEVLMYSGIAVFLVPILGNPAKINLGVIPENVFWAAILLIAISIYDFIAVFKSKHMIRMAKFQTQSKVFAGLFIPYTPKAQATELVEGKAIKAQKPAKVAPGLPGQKAEKKNAILGGGDIAFPLLFTGAVMESLVGKGLSLQAALYQSLIITLTATMAVAFLFFFAKKDKFYPAMPIISAGCFVGYVIILLL
jgi:presenilin-like A22 family membrane protease